MTITRILTTLTFLVLLTGCKDAYITPCEDLCTVCCEQESTCHPDDVSDGCYLDCLNTCQRSNELYTGTACFDAKLALHQCICGLDCTSLEEWEIGTGDHCAVESEAEVEECVWF